MNKMHATPTIHEAASEESCICITCWSNKYRKGCFWKHCFTSSSTALTTCCNKSWMLCALNSNFRFTFSKEQLSWLNTLFALQNKLPILNEHSVISPATINIRRLWTFKGLKWLISHLQFVLWNIEPVVKCLGQFCPHLLSWEDSEKQKFNHLNSQRCTVVCKGNSKSVHYWEQKGTITFHFNQHTISLQLILFSCLDFTHIRIHTMSPLVSDNRECSLLRWILRQLMHKRCVRTKTMHAPFPAHTLVFINTVCSKTVHTSHILIPGIHMFF